MLLSEGIRPIGDGLLEIAEERLQGLLASEDIADVYDVEQTPFARGKFATVRRAIHKKSGVHYAAKCLRRRRRAQCWAKDISHEIAVLMLCSDSRHIVKLHAVYETRNETALILELATGGELQAMLDDEGCLTEEQTRICMREILKALQYLHKKSIAHLDLKPQNILLCGQNVEDGLKLCDFGISRVVEEGGKVREILGTPDYVAPEVLQYEPLSLQTDIWSIGVLTYVLLTGCSPFGGDTKQETFLNISQCNLTFNDELFDEVSPIAIDFIKSTCRIKPNDRLTVSQCLEHRWLQDETIARPLAENGFIEITADYNKQQHSINGCNKISTTSSLILPTTNIVATSPQTTIPSATCNNKDVVDNNDTVDDVNEEDKENIIIISNNHNSNNSHKQTLHKDIMTTIILPTTPTIIANPVATPIITTTVSMAILPQISPPVVSATVTPIKNDNSLATVPAPATTNSNNHLHQQHHHNEITTAKFVICCDSHKNNNTKSIKTVALQASTPSAKQQQQIYQQKHHQQQQQQQSTLNIPTNPVQAQLMFFPDAPTTPKVSRKAPPDSPPSVKALVKKFQIESTGVQSTFEQNNHNTVLTSSSTVATTPPTTPSTTITSPTIVCCSLLTNNSQNNNIRHNNNNNNNNNNEISIKNKLNDDKLKNIDKEYCVCTCNEDGIKCLSCIKNNTNRHTTQQQQQQQTQQQQQHNHRHHVVINGRKTNIISSIDQGIIC